MENRIKIALEFLKDGQSFTVGDLRLSMSSSNLLTVAGWSQYLNFSNLTKANSLSELTEIKNIFSDMIAGSDNLKRFVANKSIEYILCYDDGGKASIDICSELDGVVNWKVEL
ncbi:hypothetical protein [Parapedobacter koreensis]|uniref:Uncharacterized protein n=1 Tax=Parapedobacter koreensis TaxID=332977 RepID=A0A1H7UNP0_9SPHI|nr:hypothetical protein [Parapedobacter koreensis]SEL98640.1 hypothetical protein SAMN05421740_1206 [Parapedobacter koreensis]